jgi:hypothetical protein
MTAARVAFVLVLVASALRTSGAEPCAPRAELGGDAEAVSQVAVELKRLGVEASAAGVPGPHAERSEGHAATDPMKRVATRCPVIVAAVELDRSGGIAVAVRDASQRSEGRVVSDAALAAAWIDSWLRDDFVAPPAEQAVPSPPPSLAPPGETIAEPATPVLDRFSLAASFLQIWSDDSTRWSGIGASLCVRSHGFCIGGRFGYAQQTVPADLTAAAKTDLSLLATASYSQSVGTMSIAPELGLGIGRLTTSRVEGCQVDFMCDPMDPTCMGGTAPPKCEQEPGQVFVGDNFTAATYTPRISAAVRIAIPLFDHVWLDGIAAATLAPFGHADSYGGTSDGSNDGTVMTPNTGAEAYPLPGDPLFGVQLGIGLRLGAR